MTSAATAAADTLGAAITEFRRRYDVPALGAAIVTRDGVAELDVVGVQVRGGGQPVERDQRWHLGSCGKSITAALYARLVERGEARWGAPLAELFPDLADLADPGWRAIPIDDVFRSRAGLPANLGGAEVKAALRDPRPLPEQRTEVAARALARAPRRPGRFVYSNLGYILIGAAIERITGVSYEEALTTHVLAPLGIASAGFGPPPGAWGHGGLWHEGGRTVLLGSLGAIDLGVGKRADPALPESDNPAVMSPAGRLHLTLEDWARFHRVFLDEGGGFLRPETIRHLLTPAEGPGVRQAMGWMPSALEGVSFGQQGSNALWNAVALVDEALERTALVTCNDGRMRLIRRLPLLAARVLGAA